MNGLGLGYRSPHFQEILDLKPPVDWFEVVTENFINTGGFNKSCLLKLRERYPVAMHGVSLSIASFDALNFDYLKSVRNLAREIEPFIISDHLSWTVHKNRTAYDLLPSPYTRQSLKRIAERVSQVQNFLGRELLLENPSQYIAYSNYELSEVEFLTELCRRTGCFVLLDINNLYVNQRNIGLDARKYIEELPLQFVKQFHLAGHTDYGDIIVDTHDSQVCQSVWDLYHLAAAKWPNACSLIEWDENIPELETLLSELEMAKSVHKKTQLNSECISSIDLTTPLSSSDGSVALNFSTDDMLTHDDLMTEIIAPLSSKTIENHLVSRKGLEVYQNSFFERIVSTLKVMYPALSFILQDSGFNYVVKSFLATEIKAHSQINDIGEDFLLYLKNCSLDIDFGVPQSCLIDLCEFEWLRYKVYHAPDEKKHVLTSSQLQSFSPSDWQTLKISMPIDAVALELKWDIIESWQLARQCIPPAKPNQKNTFVIIYRKDNKVSHLEIDRTEFSLIKTMRKSKTFLEACATVHSSDTLVDKHIQNCMSYLKKWVALDLGVITR